MSIGYGYVHGGKGEIYSRCCRRRRMCFCAWNLWILTNWRKTLHTHWQIKPDAKKHEDVRTAYYTLSLTVNNLISEMEK